jgi:hypothetical protein
MKKSNSGKSIGSAGSINSTSIAQGNGSFSKGQGKPTPQAGAAVAAPPIKIAECKPTVSQKSPR